MPARKQQTKRSPSQRSSQTSTATVPKNAKNPPPKTTADLTGGLVQMAIRSRFSPIRGLTPQLLSVQLDQFKLGFLSWTSITWDAIESRDDVLKGVAAKRKKAVARLEYEIMTREDSAEAKDHQKALQSFYDNLTAVNALDENERGGFKLLVRQMMDCIGKKYAVHEIVWQPGDELTAEFRFVPLWFFENRTGKLQFLQTLGASEGKPMPEGEWMVCVGDGLMEACSIAYMFKSLPLKDWLAYSDRFGTPGVLGQTTAARGTDAGNAMRDAVANFAANFSGTVYGADGQIKEPIKLIEAGGSTGRGLPFPPLVERMDRTMSALWRGSDLSTMSRAGSTSSSESGSNGKAIGANAQSGSDESDILLSDDADLISEALNMQVDRWVLWQLFGVDRGLAYVKIVVPAKKDIELDVQVDQFLISSGVPLGQRERREYYGRPEPEAGDTPMNAPMKPADPNAQDDPEKDIANIRVIAADADLERFLGTHRDNFLSAFRNDLQPLRTALESALRDVPHGPDQNARLIMLRSQLPDILRKVNESPRTSGAIAEILANAITQGIEAERQRTNP